MMKKYFKLGWVLLLFSAVPFAVFAAATDVSMSGSSKIHVAGIDLVVSGTASFDSITVGADSFSISLSKNASLTVTSANKRTFDVSPIQYNTNFSCGSDSSTLTVGNNLWDSAVTVTVAPSSSTCTSGVPGGGGSPGYTPPAETPSEPAPAAPAVSPPVTTAPSVPAVTPSAPLAVSISSVFTAALKIGATGSDVKRLQQILNSDPDTQIAASGVGSSGNETTFFGPATKAALQKFQNKYNIVSSGDESTTGYGVLGPKTRAKLAEMFVQTTPTTPEVSQFSPIAVSVSPVFAPGLSKGTANPDVKRLQQLLNSDPDTKIAESGTGSLGNETEYFGSLTEKSIQKFQVKYGVAKEGDAGYGYVGPKTRAKIQEVFKQ